MAPTLHSAAAMILRRLLLASLIAASGCSLEVKSFAGAIIQMTLSGSVASAPGQHLELWARSRYNDTLRISGTLDVAEREGSTRYFPFGFDIRPAILMDDPCMIDGAGHLLVTAAAYQPAVQAGVAQSPEEQAEQIRFRIGQLTATSSCDGSGLDPVYHCGRQTGTLLGVVAHELVDANGAVMSSALPSPTTCETSANAPGCISFFADAATRLAACNAYWSASPLAYTPNPLQLSAPSHGQLLGVVDYQTTNPPSNYSSLRIESNVGLDGIRELWMTTESDVVDPNRRGPIYVHGAPDSGGREAVHFDLAPPVGAMSGVSGTAALFVDLNQAPSLF